MALKAVKMAALLTGAIAVLWLAGFGLFVAFIETMPVLPGTIRTDAIVVLTGGAERINTGLDLLQAGSAGKILISGVDGRVGIDKIMSMWDGHMDDPGRSVFLGHAAQNTEQNAAEAKQWAEQMYVTSLRLVTSNYHMPRALIEFRRAMPDVEILPHPVFPGGTDKFGGKIRYVSSMVNEYDKTLLSAVKMLADGQ